jgi:hypothetical protein
MGRTLGRVVVAAVFIGGLIGGSPAVAASASPASANGGASTQDIRQRMGPFWGYGGCALAWELDSFSWKDGCYPTAGGFLWYYDRIFQ